MLEHKIREHLDKASQLEIKKGEYYRELQSLQQHLLRLKQVASPFEHAGQWIRVFLRHYIREIFRPDQLLSTLFIYLHSLKPLDDLSLLCWYIESCIVDHPIEHSSAMSLTKPRSALGIFQHLRTMDLKEYFSNCDFHVLIGHQQTPVFYQFSSVKERTS